MLLHPLLLHSLSAPSSQPWSRRGTHHSDGEVVVYNAVRHQVPPLLLVRGRDVDLPAVQPQLRAVLDVPQDLQETLALVSSRRRRDNTSRLDI